MGTRQNMLPALIIRGVTTVAGHGRGQWGGHMCPLATALHKVRDLAQPLEREQRCGGPSRGRGRRARIVGRTHGECGVGPIREPHDEVRISPLPDSNQGDPLAAERVMRMGDGHRFRRLLEKWGSVL